MSVQDFSVGSKKGISAVFGLSMHDPQEQGDCCFLLFTASHVFYLHAQYAHSWFDLTDS